MKYLLALLLVSFFYPVSHCFSSPTGFETSNFVLYQPNNVLEERLSGVAGLSVYIKQLQAICGEFFASSTTPEELHVVVAVRPGKLARIWFVSSTRSADDKEREPLRKKLEAVTPCDVRGGPIAFGISAKIAGGDGKAPRDTGYQPPIPKEWQDAAKDKQDIRVPDGFLDLVWPDKNNP